MQRMESVLRVLAFVATLWAIPNSAELMMRVLLSTGRDRYRQADFIVTDAVYHPSTGESSPDWYLVGSVGANRETLRPLDTSGRFAMGWHRMQRSYPKGTHIRIFYNSEAISMTFNGQSLRVIEYRPDFWEGEAIRYTRAWINVAPAFVLVLLLQLVAFLNRDERRARAGR